MTSLAPFWRYYGGKNRLARRYAPPHHERIIEPFAELLLSMARACDGAHND